ncbi:MAG: RagB/SusD family nutrient uptake outer membrane protein [Tannerellaceae bacterium]|jgi:hypothetical protein|nr:RagB/SusD family nutrient uptake outer membrane protein [Tannerellaceae bacterium]
MNKIYINVLIAGLSFFAVLAASCSDSLLDEKLYSQLGASSLPKGVEGVNQLVLGIYPSLQPNSIQDLTIYTSDAPSDQMFINWGGIPQTGWGGQMHFLSYDANHSAASNTWTKSYTIIAQCNEAIRLFGDDSDPEVQTILAEAVFWRAYAYNWLMKAFGDVPLVKGGEDMSNGLARTGKAEVYRFIVDELARIETLLPASRKASDYGRPTRWAAKTLLANIYLNQKDWTNAARYAKDVIDNGGFTLLPEYHDVFGVDGNSEVILVCVAIAQHYRGNNYDALSLESNLIRALNIQGLAGSNGYGLSVPFFETFDPQDRRRADFDPVTKKGIMIHGYINNADGTPLFKDGDGNPLKVEEALYRIIALKYPLQENPVSGEWMTSDYVLMRLGEVYLTYAEAQNELDETAEALKYINLIRRRAGLEDLAASLTKEQFREAILNERGWELYTEGYRRDDLIRHDRLLEKVKLSWEHYLSTPWPHDGATYRYLYPVPASAMIKNPLLVQNPGF